MVLATAIMVFLSGARAIHLFFLPIKRSLVMNDCNIFAWFGD